MKLFERVYREANERKLVKIGTCVEGADPEGNLPWDDATEMAQDLGYYATFDSMEDPDDSNWTEVSASEFAEHCDYLLPKNHYIFLKRKNGDMYCAYDEDRDIHSFYG